MTSSLIDLLGQPKVFASLAATIAAASAHAAARGEPISRWRDDAIDKLFPDSHVTSRATSASPQGGKPGVHARPCFTVIGGLDGVGKTTVLNLLLDRIGFTPHLLRDHPGEREACNEAMLDVLARRESAVVESCFSNAELLRWMYLAAEREYEVELVWIGVEDDVARGRKRRRNEMDAALQRLSAAADIARCTLVIDNSTAQPIKAARIEAGQVTILDQRPGWVARHVLGPKLARQASLAAVQRVYADLATHAAVQPVLQAALATSGACTGAVLAVAEHHALQRVGEALYVVHDLAALDLPQGHAETLMAEPAVTLAYDRAMDPERQRMLER